MPRNSKVTDHYCKKCNKYYSRKDSLTRHLKENKCKYICEICDKIYNSRDGLYKHKKAYHPELIKERNTKSNNKIGNKNKIIDKSCNNSNNCNNTSYNIFIMPGNKINLVDFGKEDINIFSKKEIKKMLLSTSEDFITKLILFVNFNKNYPQYHNCYYPNDKKNTVFIFVSQGWKQITLAVASEQIVSNRRNDYQKITNNIKYISEEDYQNNFNRLSDMITPKNNNSTKSLIKKILITYHPMVKNVYEQTKNYLPNHDFFDVSDESNESISEEFIEEHEEKNLKEESISEEISIEIEDSE